MLNKKKLVVSHAPYWHMGGSITSRSYQMMLAALPAVFMGIYRFGMPAVGVVCLSMSSAVLWELLFNWISKRDVSIGDGNAALIGLLFAMLLPATMPWWIVVIGTFLAIFISKQIFGGIGGNAFNPVLVAIAMMMVSKAWLDYFDFDAMLANYDLNFNMVYPIAKLKYFGPDAAAAYSLGDLFMGKQAGGIGATFGLGLIIGGIYLIARRVIRLEIALSFIIGLIVTAFIFNMANPEKYATPVFHLLTGYSLIGAFFLATEDSTSPVNFIPMLIYGALGGLLTVLIRNIGNDVDGVVYSILVMNAINPLLDKIRPKAIGRVA